MGVSEILGLLKDIKRDTGITILISTHDIDLVPLFCDDVIVLDKGRVIFSGQAKQLFLKPEILREHNLRLPRINHLMNILHNKDGLEVDTSAATISQARKSIKELLNKQ
jgi:cobalt/nickel transport system ATP-binding protein